MKLLGATLPMGFASTGLAVVPVLENDEWDQWVTTKPLARRTPAA